MTKFDGRAGWFAAVAVAAASTFGAQAQTFSGTWRLNPYCGDVASGSLVAGCVEEGDSLGGQCVQCDQVAADSLTTWTRKAGRGILAGTTHIEGNQYVIAPCGAGAGGTGNVDQAVRADDVVFTRISDPNATGLVSVRLNAEFRGHVEALPACTQGYAQVDICTKVDGESCLTGGSLRLSGSLGALAAYPNDMSTLSLTGNSRNVALGVPTYVTLDLKVKAGGIQCEGSSLLRADSTAIGELTLPPTGPAFVLPPDVTVNSLALGIVNNQWMGPAPVVTDPPDPQIVCAGDRADFAVGASGGPGAHYQWRRDGVNLVDGSTGNGSTIVGASTAALIVFDVAAADSGSYDCVVSDGCLGTASSAAALGLAPAVADAGPDRTSNEATLVILDGSGSSGPGCAPAVPAWTQTGGTPVTLDLGDPSRPAFTAPEVGPLGDVLSFRADVDDGAGGTASDAVAVTIQNVSGDADGDGTPDVVDCAPVDPTAFGIPGEAAGIVFAADKQTLSWDSVAATAGSGSSYDVLRGRIGEWPVGAGAAETCLAPSAPATQAGDGTLPTPSSGLYYLVRARNACGVGPYGTTSGGAARLSAACP